MIMLVISTNIVWLESLDSSKTRNSSSTGLTLPLFSEYDPHISTLSSSFLSSSHMNFYRDPLDHVTHPSFNDSTSNLIHAFQLFNVYLTWCPPGGQTVPTPIYIHTHHPARIYDTYDTKTTRRTMPKIYTIT